MTLGYRDKFPWGDLTNFLWKIETGSKIHTIREDAMDRWQAGRKIHHVYGNRTPDRFCFQENMCSGTQTFTITLIDGGSLVEHIVKVDGRRLNFNEITDLAVNDGFADIRDFFRWFNRNWSGKIIHWTDKRY